MDNWRTQFPHDSRHKIVNLILETLKKHIPCSGPEETNQLTVIAARFEDKIFKDAADQDDYNRKISLKMLMTMQTNSQNSSSIPAANTSLQEEPAANTGDWRTQLPPDSRPTNAEKILEAVRKHIPNYGQEGQDLINIALTFEELIFKTAINQADYFRKVSIKVETVEEGD